MTKDESKKPIDYSVFLQINDAEDSLWRSPDIMLTGLDMQSDPIEINTSYDIKAKVHNLGRQDATNVAVKFFLRDFGIAESSSYEQLGSTVYISSLRGQSSSFVQCTETFNPSTDGHKCILANCTNYLDPIGNDEFDVNDRHIAQRNIMVVFVKKGVKKEIIISAGISKRNHSKKTKRNIKVFAGNLREVLKDEGNLIKKYNLFPSKRKLESVLFKVEEKLGKERDSISVDMAPGKNTPVNIFVSTPKDAEKGEMWAINVTQAHDQKAYKQIENKTIDGGCTIIIAIH